MILELFLGFLRVGCFSFGGGYAAVALIREVVLSNGWMSEEMLSYLIAVSESTPGPIMVNLATYIGSTQAGVLGSLVATLAVVLPAFLLILGLMAVLKRFMGNPWVSAAMKGLKACIIGVIFATGLEMLWTNCVPSKSPDLTAIVLTALLAGIYFGCREGFHRKLSPIALIGISALLGIAAYGF
ncbi:MAG: chromate transporter [Oscillospiraceae bacterium]|nr:chromate transporter [Oscillospiraceae bacterium]